MALRRFETHLRVMSHPEFFQTKDHADGTTSVTMNNSSGEVFDGFTHIHKTATPNDIFFNNTMNKVVDSALAGQSTVILVCGPPGSGRSQTIYDVAQADPGVVHLMADRLLRLEIERRVFTTVQAYNIRGTNVLDTMKDNKSVKRRDFGQPIGEMTMSHMKLLEKSSDAVVVSAAKKNSTTSIIEFHVYTPVPSRNDRRDAMARIVFVDLASFEAVTPPDLQELLACVNQHNSGAVDDWSRCELTRVMQSFLLGSKSVMCVGTVIGHKELQEQTANALRFIGALSKMRYTPKLIQIVAPAGIANLPHSLRSFQQDRERVLEAERRQGEKIVYEAARKLIAARLDELRGLLSGGDLDIQEARQAMHAEASALTEQLHAQQESESKKLADASLEKSELERKVDHYAKTLADINDQCEALEREQLCERGRRRADGTSTQAELDRRRKREQKRSRDMMELEERLHHAQEDAKRFADDGARSLNAVRFVTAKMNFESAMEKMALKKRRLEERLENHALRARACIQSTHDDRERKGRAARMSNIETKVQAKKAVAASIERSAAKGKDASRSGRSVSQSRSVSPQKPLALF